jgi:hypothetical protein
MNRYLDALVRHDAHALTLAPEAEVRENTVLVKLGAADSWREISAIRARQDFDDLDSGNIVSRSAVQLSNGKIGSLSVRLKVDGGRLREVETSFNKGTGPFDADNILQPDILWQALVPPARRSTRAQLIHIVDLYFDGISRHDQNIPPFSKRCDRYESGMKMSNNFTNASNESGAVSCGQSLLHLTGGEVVQRRYPLVNVELGVILGYGFILHMERNPPQATGLAELFKIVDGQLREIENIETVVPAPPDGGFAH